MMMLCRRIAISRARVDLVVDCSGRPLDFKAKLIELHSIKPLIFDTRLSNLVEWVHFTEFAHCTVVVQLISYLGTMFRRAGVCSPIGVEKIFR